MLPSHATVAFQPRIDCEGFVGYFRSHVQIGQFRTDEEEGPNSLPELLSLAEWKLGARRKYIASRGQDSWISSFPNAPAGRSDFVSELFAVELKQVRHFFVRCL